MYIWIHQNQVKDLERGIYSPRPPVYLARICTQKHANAESEGGGAPKTLGFQAPPPHTDCIPGYPS